jgi:hypothetical protein
VKAICDILLQRLYIGYKPDPKRENMNQTLIERLPDALMMVGVISIWGLPALLLTLWLVVRIARAVPTIYRAEPTKIVASVVFLALCSVGVWIYLAVMVFEASIILTCTGSGCAQAGMLTIMAAPLAWISCIISWIAARIIFNGKILPKLPLQTDLAM